MDDATGYACLAEVEMRGTDVAGQAVHRHIVDCAGVRQLHEGCSTALARDVTRLLIGRKRGNQARTGHREHLPADFSGGVRLGVDVEVEAPGQQCRTHLVRHRPIARNRPGPFGAVAVERDRMHDPSGHPDRALVEVGGADAAGKAVYGDIVPEPLFGEHERRGPYRIAIGFNAGLRGRQLCGEKGLCVGDAWCRT